MSGLIPEDFIDDLRHRIDIVDIIREYVPLKKQGQNYTGLCPFHAEKTPSFVVSPQKQIYHCFGCGKGGHVFSFLMEKNGMSYPEAIALAAKRAGVAMPQTAEKLSSQDSLKKKYYEINELAGRFYQKNLQSPPGREASEYLTKRGLKRETQERFMLGYAPDAWDHLSRFLLEQGIQESELLTLGLAVKSQKGNLIDRFLNRIIFPICDESGHVIAFGGRVMDSSHPKYLNSPETPLFAKGKRLYGLNLAKTDIRKLDQVIIMEGYMDVITAHQHGITQAVGSMGTALTSDQARLLMRYTYHVYTCFDADAAGQAATLRGLDILQQQGCQVAVITMPEAKDPDEFLKNNGKEAFLNLIGHASTLLEYKLLGLMKEHNTTSITGKILVVQQLLPDLQNVQSPVARQAFIQALAERLTLPESVIQAEMKKAFRYTKKDIMPDVPKIAETPGNASSKAQKTLIRFLLEKPELLPEVEKWGGEELFNHRLLKEIYKGNYLIRQAGHNIKANDLIFLLENEEARQLLSEVLLEDEDTASWERILLDCLSILKLEFLQQKIIDKTALMIQYEKNGDISRSLEVLTQIQELVREKQNLLMPQRKGGNGDFEDRKRH